MSPETQAEVLQELKNAKETFHDFYDTFSLLGKPMAAKAALIARDSVMRTIRRAESEINP